MTAASTLTSKGQATIPMAPRDPDSARVCAPTVAVHGPFRASDR
jgi:hypothetical protein